MTLLELTLIMGFIAVFFSSYLAYAAQFQKIYKELEESKASLEEWHQTQLILANIIKESGETQLEIAMHTSSSSLSAYSDSEIYLERVSLDGSTYNCAGTKITQGNNIQEKIYIRASHLVCETRVTSTRRAKLLGNLQSLEVQYGIDAYDAYTGNPGSDGISDQFVSSTNRGSAGVKSLLVRLNVSQDSAQASHFGFSGTPVFYSLENAYQ